MGTFTASVRSRDFSARARTGVFVIATAFAVSVGGHAIGQDKTGEKKETIEWEDGEVEGDGKTTIVTEGGGTSGVPPEDLERWPWLGIPVEDVPLIYVKVDVNASGLTSDLGAVMVRCSLQSKLYTNDSLPDGFIVGESVRFFHRPDYDIEAHMDENDLGEVEVFEGNSITKMIALRFNPIHENWPMESWTHGTCSLSMVKKADGVQVFDPRICNPQQDNTEAFTGTVSDGTASGEFLGNCVWPDTDPADAILTFERPGLEDFVFVPRTEIDDLQESEDRLRDTPQEDPDD